MEGRASKSLRRFPICHPRDAGPKLGSMALSCDVSAHSNEADHVHLLELQVASSPLGLCTFECVAIGVQLKTPKRALAMNPWYRGLAV